MKHRLLLLAASFLMVILLTGCCPHINQAAQENVENIELIGVEYNKYLKADSSGEFKWKDDKKPLSKDGARMRSAMIDESLKTAKKIVEGTNK